MKVTIRVWNGWLAQSKQHPGEDAAAVGEAGRGASGVRVSGGHGRSASAALQAAIQAGSARRPVGAPIAATTRSVGTMPSGPVTAPRIRAPGQRLAAAEHRLLHVEEARVAADEGRAHLDAVEGADPAAVAHRGRRRRSGPSGSARSAATRPLRIGERHAAEVVEGEGAAVVELAARGRCPRASRCGARRARRRAAAAARGGRARARCRGGGKGTCVSVRTGGRLPLSPGSARLQAGRPGRFRKNRSALG